MPWGEQPARGPSAWTIRSAATSRSCRSWSALEEIVGTPRGGHEPREAYAAHRAAGEHKGAPAVVLVQTVKGWTLGSGFQSGNANHQMKKLSGKEFRAMRDLLELPIPDTALTDALAPYAHPGEDSPEVAQLRERRAALGGPAPARRDPLAARPDLRPRRRGEVKPETVRDAAARHGL